MSGTEIDLGVLPPSKPPLLTVTVPDTEEARTFVLDMLNEDLDIRHATEVALIEMLREPMLQYAREQAVKVKQGKL